MPRPSTTTHAPRVTGPRQRPPSERRPTATVVHTNDFSVTSDGTTARIVCERCDDKMTGPDDRTLIEANMVVHRTTVDGVEVCRFGGFARIEDARAAIAVTSVLAAWTA